MISLVLAAHASTRPPPASSTSITDRACGAGAVSVVSDAGLHLRGPARRTVRARHRAARVVAAGVSRIPRNQNLRIRVRRHHAAQRRWSSRRLGLPASPGAGDDVRSLVAYAKATTPVVFVGATGTGKSFFAQLLHQFSGRTGPFIDVPAGELDPSLAADQLFGHVRGAFTDARTERKGLFLQADSGTLFLDEIGDFPFDLQSKLLRALETSTVRPVGSNKELHVDVRVLTATTGNDSADQMRKAHRSRSEKIQAPLPAPRTRVPRPAPVRWSSTRERGPGEDFSSRTGVRPAAALAMLLPLQPPRSG